MAKRKTCENGEMNECQLRYTAQLYSARPIDMARHSIFKTKMFLDHLAENWFGALLLCVNGEKESLY